MAFGRLRMSDDGFWDATPREFDNRIKGYQAERLESDRAEWIRTRWMTTLLLNVHIDRKKQLKPTDLYRFDWEEPEKPSKLSPRQKEILAKWDADIKRKYAEHSRTEC